MKQINKDRQSQVKEIKYNFTKQIINNNKEMKDNKYQKKQKLRKIS
jgi:hypothetical protein